MHIKSDGFIALTAVIIVACTTLLFANIVMQTVIDYSDMVMRHEWRIQANLNAQSCLNVLKLMITKDYFLSGDLYLKDFGCNALVKQNHVQMNASVSTKAVFNGVNSRDYNI